MLIDTHAHLYWNSYQEDLDQVIQRSFDNGVKTIINVGTDIETSKKALNLESSLVKMYSSIGIHPHEGNFLVNDVSIHQNIGDLEKLYQSRTSKVVAIGECGLDYHYSPNPKFNPSSFSEDQQKQNQLRLYIAQVNLAKKLNLPLIIHCREAWSDIFIKELDGTTGLFHSFSGSPEDASKALSLGYYLSLSCTITYPKNNELRQILKTTPLNRILTETDSPFLPPQQLRGERNEPANVTEVVKVISEVKQLTVEEIKTALYDNFKGLFKI